MNLYCIIEEGRVNIDAIKTLHLTAIQQLGIGDHVKEEIMELLSECEALLTGVRLIQEMSPKSLDQLVSYGERISVRIMAAQLNQLGIPAQAFDAWDVGIYTDSEFGNAKILPESDDLIRKAFDRIDKNTVAVVTGFIGHDKKGKITTLGRSGSDLSATQIGAALGVDEIQVWKDVDGILSSDPRVIPNAIPIGEVTFEEASELAYFGAQVLHPTAMRPAIKYGVPVRVKNSYNPAAVGSYIREKKTDNRLVTAITFKRGIRLMDIRSTEMLGTYGFLAEVFKQFQKHKLSVDVLASSEVSISLTLDKSQKVEEIEGLIEDLSSCAEVSMVEKKSILTLITDVERSSEVLATVFRVFSTENIKVEMMSQGASKVNISFIIQDADLDRAATQLHKCFFEDTCSVEKFSKPIASAEAVAKVAP
jgi:aspartate kinase